MGLRLGDQAPNFRTGTTRGHLDFHEWKRDSWCLLFSFPKIFGSISTTELIEICKLQNKFLSHHTRILGLTCGLGSFKDDQNNDRTIQRWFNDIKDIENIDIEFPIIIDSERKIATLYDLLDYQDALNVDDSYLPLTCRSTFLIDPYNVVRSVFHMPAVSGRSFTEILRMIDAIQLSDMYLVGTPSAWKSIDDEVIILDRVSHPLGPTSIFNLYTNNDNSNDNNNNNNSNDNNNNNNNNNNNDIEDKKESKNHRFNIISSKIIKVLPYLQKIILPNKEELKLFRKNQFNISNYHKLHIVSSSTITDTSTES